MLTKEDIRTLPLKNFDQIDWRSLEDIDRFDPMDNESCAIAHHDKALVSMAEVRDIFSITCLCKKRVFDGLVTHYFGGQINSIFVYSRGKYLRNVLVPRK